MINKRLAEEKGLSLKTQNSIIELQKLRDEIEDKMNSCKNLNLVKKLFGDWTRANFKLQELWGWEKDASLHRGFLLYHCRCPILDNSDMGIHMYFNLDCPLHNDNKSLNTKKDS